MNVKTAAKVRKIEYFLKLKKIRALNKMRMCRN